MIRVPKVSGNCYTSYLRGKIFIDISMENANKIFTFLHWNIYDIFPHYYNRLFQFIKYEYV